MDYSDSDSDSDTQSLLPVFLLALLAHRRQPQASNRTWTGQEYVDNVLNCGNPTRIHNILRMNLETFNQLRDWLVSNTKLKSSRNVSVEEKLFIFITIASTGQSNRRVQEQYNRSAKTVSQQVTQA
jgi:hypothetical protein